MFAGVFHDALSCVCAWLKAAHDVGDFSIRLDRDIASVGTPHKAGMTAGFHVNFALGSFFDLFSEAFSVGLGLLFNIPAYEFAGVTNGDCGGHEHFFQQDSARFIIKLRKIQLGIEPAQIVKTLLRNNAEVLRRVEELTV
jgi:hypothetical protein